MKDRYLFRGNRIQNGEFAYGHLCPPPYPYHDSGKVFIAKKYVCHCGSSDLSYIYHEIEPDTLAQSTGLKDKNGILIFEFDIVLYNNEFRGWVEWHEDSWLVRFSSYDLSNFDGLANIRHQLKIIGNIHDNKLEDFTP